MMVTIAFVSGISHVYTLVGIFFLMWCTQCFGYFTEALSRPELNGDARPNSWETKEWYIRLRPHFLGYVPYLAAWFVQIHSFYWNYLKDRESGERTAPDFVHWIIWGQFAVFSLFGITQLLNQWFQNGPYWYWLGELSYLILSLTAKALLGSLLIFNVLIYDSFDRAVREGVDEAADSM